MVLFEGLIFINLIIFRNVASHITALSVLAESCVCSGDET